MEMEKYTVRYLDDSNSQIIIIHFQAPEENLLEEQIVNIGAGILFCADYSPGEIFCIYKNNNRNKPVGEDYKYHYKYVNHPDLWNTNKFEEVEL